MEPNPNRERQQARVLLISCPPKSERRAQSARNNGGATGALAGTGSGGRGRNHAGDGRRAVEEFRQAVCHLASVALVSGGTLEPYLGNRDRWSAVLTILIGTFVAINYWLRPTEK